MNNKLVAKLVATTLDHYCETYDENTHVFDDQGNVMGLTKEAQMDVDDLTHKFTRILNNLYVLRSGERYET